MPHLQKLSKIWAKIIVATGFEKLPKCNKSPNLVSLVSSLNGLDSIVLLPTYKKHYIILFGRVQHGEISSNHTKVNRKAFVVFVDSKSKLKILEQTWIYFWQGRPKRRSRDIGSRRVCRFHSSAVQSRTGPCSRS